MHPLGRLYRWLHLKPRVFTRCKGGHVLEKLYGDALVGRKHRYYCEQCPHSTDRPDQQDIVVDYATQRVRDFRRRLREHKERDE